MRLPLRRLALCCALSLTLAPASAIAHAQTSDSRDKDLAALEHYTLTMDKMTRYAQIFDDLSAYAKAHPQAAHMLAGESDGSLSSSEQRLASQPVVVAILAKHGFSPHEFVVFGGALFQAAFSSETARQTGMDPAKMAANAHINPANMTFVSQHKTEVEAMIKKMKESAPEDASDN